MLATKKTTSKSVVEAIAHLAHLPTVRNRKFVGNKGEIVDLTEQQIVTKCSPIFGV